MARRTAPAPGQLDLFAGTAAATPADPHKITIGWGMRDRPSGGRRLMYYAICRTCETHSSEFEQENRAVEQGMNHAWPGWQNLPAVPASPNEGDQARARWLAAAAAVYPDGWVEAGGPVRTIRCPPANRHYWDKGLGFWDLGVPA